MAGMVSAMDELGQKYSSVVERINGAGAFLRRPETHVQTM